DLIATSTAALANRTDGRIKLFLLISRESSQILAYTPTSTLRLIPRHRRLYLHLDGDGESAPHSKRFTRNLQHRGGLLAFVLRPLHQPHHLLDERKRKSVFFGNPLRRLVALHVSFQNRVQHLVRRQRIGVLLVRA